MRIYLAGYGTPIPLLALPDPNISDDLAPQLILMENGETFVKVDWINFGFTNYEVWCVGGAGGRGGGVSDSLSWTTVVTRPSMSAGDWALYLEMQHLYNDPLGIVYSKWDPTPRPGAPNGGEVAITLEEYYEIQFPAHDPLNVTTYSDPVLVASASAVGGGGGGGGVHVISGLLEDLPDSVLVNVGQFGGDVGPGQTAINGLWTPEPPKYYQLPADTRLKELSNYFQDYQIKYPLPHPSFGPPQVGIDGGASSFGDICRASGGKGGSPAKVWSGPTMVVNGAGGAGGIGGSIVAGGGGAGSNSSANGSDGPWDGTIGGGGGGGRGGSGTTVIASDGGRGSFSFGDTSVFGARESKTAFPGTASVIVPGGGGGVRAFQKLLYGSRARSYNSKGLVALRIFKVE